MAKVSRLSKLCKVLAIAQVKLISMMEVMQDYAIDSGGCACLNFTTFLLFKFRRIHES